MENFLCKNSLKLHIACQASDKEEFVLWMNYYLLTYSMVNTAAVGSTWSEPSRQGAVLSPAYGVKGQPVKLQDHAEDK